MRASFVANCQSALVAAALRRYCQAWTWRSSVALSPTRSGRSRPRALSLISAMFSQEPCLGVWWISSRSAMRLASPLGLLGRECLIEGGRGADVELVHDQDNLVRLPIAPVHELAHEARPIITPAPSPAPVGERHLAPTAER